MNIKQNQIDNAANLSMFMVNLSQALLQKKSGKLGRSINDLKAWFRASKYVEKTLKLLILTFCVEICKYPVLMWL